MKIIILCLLVICGTYANALPKIDENEVLTANFKQVRHLKGIPSPIKSEGFMVLRHSKGMIWSTTKPFPNSILITHDGLYQLENNIKTPLVKAGGNNAMFEILNVAPGKKINGFTVQKMPADKDKWRVLLLPDQLQVKKFIKSITIEGDLRISHITILRPNGDHDDIRLTGHTVRNDVPPELRSYFEE